MTSLNWRRISSLTIMFLAAILTYTGIVLWIAPAGRYALWTEWTFLGLTKDETTNIHLTTAFAFILLGWLHTWYNWRAVVQYFSTRAKTTRHVSKELIVSAVLTVIIVGGTYWVIPPFKQVIDLGAWASLTWEAKEPAPSGRVDETNLTGLAEQVNMTPERALAVLREAGLQVEGVDAPVEKIAADNNAAPVDLLGMLQAALSEAEKSTLAAAVQKPSGLGRMTLGDLSAKTGIAMDLMQSRLAAAGMEGDADSKFRELAEAYSLEPDGLWSIVADVPPTETD